MNKVPMTVGGADTLREELNELKTVARPNVIQAIAEARSHGDLKENAEYHAAREQQGFIEGRIKEIESKLSNAQIIDVKAFNAGGRIVFGATVDVIDLDTDAYLAAGSSVPNNVVDLVISYAADRMYIFQQAEVGEHNGWLTVFDINESGPPTYRDDLTTHSLFSLR